MNKELYDLILQTNYLSGGLDIIIRKMNEEKDEEKLDKLKADATMVYKQIRYNQKQMEELVPDEY